MSKKNIDKIIQKIFKGIKKLNFKSTDNVYLGIDLGKVLFNDYQKIFENENVPLNEIRNSLSCIKISTNVHVKCLFHLTQCNTVLLDLSYYVTLIYCMTI